MRMANTILNMNDCAAVPCLKEQRWHGSSADSTGAIGVQRGRPEA